MTYIVHSDELYHHGILGQKWGVRRYQNYDGTRTDAGKKRYGNGNSLNKMIENKYILHPSDLKGKISDETRKRALKDTELGLKALKKIGRDSYDDNVGITNTDREWFTFEDQTIGYFQIADLVNKGKTKNEIYDILDQATKMNKDYDNDSVFELADFARNINRGNGEYLNACLEIKNDAKNTPANNMRKTYVEKKLPKFSKFRTNYIDYVEKHFPTGYKMMETQARLYKKAFPKMYDLDKKLGMQVVVRKGKPVGMA